VSRHANPLFDRQLEAQHSVGLGRGSNEEEEGLLGGPLVSRVTVGLVDEFRACNSKFSYTRIHNPKRVLTHPSEGVGNHGHDNKDSNYVLYVNSIIVGSGKRRLVSVCMHVCMYVYVYVSECVRASE
jgi:hypothetical protein